MGYIESEGLKSLETLCCFPLRSACGGSGRGAVTFLCSSPGAAVLCVCSSEAAAAVPALWLLWSSAQSVEAVSNAPAKATGWGWARGWGDTAGTADPDRPEGCPIP